MSKTIKKVLKILKHIGVILILFILLIQFFLWTSIGQTIIAQQATKLLGNKLNTEVSIGKIDISFFKFIRLEQLYVEDLNQDTLFYIENLSTEIDQWHFKNDSFRLELGVVQIENPTYYLHQQAGDSITNVSKVFQNLSSNDTSSNNLHLEITSSQISINDGVFVWDNENYEELDFGISWDHVGLKKINADITNFEMINDSFNAHINHLSGLEKSGFQVDNFAGNAIFSTTTTQVENLKITTPHSQISGDLIYEYDSIASYAEFIDQVYMRYELDTSLVSFTDIAYFAPPLQGMDYKITVFGKERGPVNDMKFQDIFLSYGSSTVLNGRIFISGLPNIESTSFNCRIKQLKSNHQDLATIKTYPFTDGKTIAIPNFLKNAGDIFFNGNFSGFYNNFVTYGTFQSDNGKVSTDLKLAQEDSGTIFYDGKISTVNFDLAQLTNKPDMLGKASINIDIEGQNLDFETINTKLKGTASAFDFMGYTYKNIRVDGAIRDQQLLGTLDIIDTNVNLGFNGKIDLSNDIPRYEFTSKIEHLRPKQLHLMDRDSSASVSTLVEFNFQGSSLDNVLGRVGLKDFHFVEGTNNVNLKKVDFVAFTQGKNKTLNLKSDNMELQITGEFYFKELIQSFNNVIYQWLPSIFTSPPKKPESVENFHMVLNASHFSGFSSIFIPQVTFKNDLFIDLSYNSITNEISLQSTSSDMSIVGQKLKDLEVIAALSVDTFHLSSNAKSLFFTDSNFIDNVNFTATAYEDLIKTKAKWNNNDTYADDAGNLNFDIQFIDPNNFKINSYDSWVNLNDTMWVLHDSSEINKHFREYSFSNVSFSQQNQKFKINGFISDDPEKKLIVEVDSLDLKALNPVLNKYQIYMDGKVDGTTTLYDFYNEFQLHSVTHFSELNFNHQFIGDGVLKSEWDSENNKFDVDVGFHEELLQKIKLKGTYYPQKKANSLDLMLSLNQFPVKIIEPFTEGIIDQVQGTITGTSSIKGEIKRPLFDGEFMLNDIQTRVVYLNETLFADEQKVFIRPNLIGADAVIITDSQRKKAQVNFSLFHDNFDRINYDVSIASLNVFRAFNTGKDDNKYFYGQIYLNPESTIGIESDYYGNISLNASVNSGPGTFVTIPFYEDDEVSQRDYVYFKSVENETEAIEEEDLHQEETYGLNLDMSMQLDKEAEVQLIFDEYTNDKIQASGNGNITLKINENEDFNIYGTYEIQEGFYLFTFSKVISKKFNIKPGGKLSWNGDPYAGRADIDASYKVRTSLYELGISVSLDTNEQKKRIPVEVVLNMSGNYMNPDLDFSFILPAKYEEIETLLNTLDDSEKNKQVFALLILNKFMPITGSDVTGSTSAIATNSTEVLSNQLSSWLSKISSDFDVGVRYSPGDETQTADEVELALSTQLFDDRVLVETNFGISGTTPSSTSSSSSNFVGEFTVSYKVNKRGNVVGKVFQRSNELNPVTYNTSQYTQGIGIAYSEPFKSGNNLGCIMSNHFKTAENKRNCEEEYYQEQQEKKEENLAKVNKKVATSRQKQQERNRRNRERDEKALRKKEDN